MESSSLQMMVTNPLSHQCCLLLSCGSAGGNEKGSGKTQCVIPLPFLAASAKCAPMGELSNTLEREVQSIANYKFHFIVVQGIRAGIVQLCRRDHKSEAVL